MTLADVAVQFQKFDTDAFGVPFYRVVATHSPNLERGVAALIANPPVIIDAKLSAEDIGNCHRLLKLGFRKICTQIEFRHKLEEVACPPKRSSIMNCCALSDATILAHARQFVFDRFSLDPELPVGGHDRLYSRWIHNSLRSGNCEVAVCRHNFITFKSTLRRVKIDLTSVLDSGQGIASDLLAAVLHRAKESDAHHVEVVTECENRPAWRLYLKAGFLPAQFFSVFHLVKLSAGE